MHVNTYGNMSVQFKIKNPGRERWMDILFIFYLMIYLTLFLKLYYLPESSLEMVCSKREPFSGHGYDVM